MAERGTPTTLPPLGLRLPAAAIRLLGADAGAAATRLAARIGRREGVARLGDHLFAVLPVAGDPAVVDSALAWCRETLAADSGEEPATALVYPVDVRHDSEATAIAPDALDADLDERQPKLPGPGIYLSSRAALMLEEPVVHEPAPAYEGPSGRRVPLLAAGEPRANLPPWRNPELLNRRPASVPRPEEEEALRALLAEPAVRVTGPLGCGKTRVVDRVLRSLGRPSVWQKARPVRRGGEALLKRLARAVDGATPAAETTEPADLVERLAHRAKQASAPLTMVIDDAHSLTAADAEQLAALAGDPALGASYLLVLVGRSGNGWSAGLSDLPQLDLPPCEEAVIAAVEAQLTEGLAIPEPVTERLLAASAGCPLALEEGLFALAQRRVLRRVYGGFFFGGGDDAGYEPSPRLIAHLHAEADRLGPALAAHLLAVADEPMPGDVVALAVQERGVAAGLAWHLGLFAGRLLRRVDTPWGSGLEVEVPAFRAALAAPLAGETRSDARRRLGEILAETGGGGEASWRAYRLLEVGDDSLGPLLEAAESSYAGSIPREDLLAALSAELARLGEGGADARSELRLLWRLLPLARRMGKLHRFKKELARGVELSADQPSRHLALASLSAEVDQDAGRYEEAERTLSNALRASAGTDQRRRALILIQLGKLIMHQGRHDEASKIFAELQRALRRAGLTPLEATCRFYLGNIALRQGRLEQAEADHEAALEMRLEQHLLRPVGSSYTALGAVAVDRGHYGAALDYYQKAHELLVQHGREGEESIALLGLGKALTRLGDYLGASAPLRAALELRAGRDDEESEALARLAVAENYLDLERLDRALEEARGADFKLALLSGEDVQAESAVLLGRIHLALRNVTEARQQFDKALELQRGLGDELAVGDALAWLVELALASADEDAVRHAAADLKGHLDRLERPDRREILDFRLFRALEWLGERGHKVGTPRPYLERAHRSLLEQASRLTPEHRHRFLSQIADHRRLLEAAGRHGLTAA